MTHHAFTPKDSNAHTFPKTAIHIIIMEYNFRDIEKKWQQKWVENSTYHVVEDSSKPKFYVLNMFP